MREFVIKTLRNYGYRFLGNQSGCYTYKTFREKANTIKPNVYE